MIFVFTNLFFSSLLSLSNLLILNFTEGELKNVGDALKVEPIFLESGIRYFGRSTHRVGALMKNVRMLTMPM